MDFFLPIIIIVIIFIIFSVCGWCFKKNRPGTVYGGPVIATPTNYGVTNPPYPVDAPVNQPVGPGFNVGGGSMSPYPPQPMPGPYPPAPVHPMGYPHMQPMGGYPPGPTPYPPGPTPYPTMPTPYPPAGPPYPTGPAQALPPSYDEAVTQPPTIEVYAKQSPYNPSFQ